MSSWVPNHTSIDDATLYVARGCDPHPLVDEFIFDELQRLKHIGKVSLVPDTIFELFHRKISRVA